MTHDRFVELWLENRFGAPSDADAALLRRLTAENPDAAREIASLEALFVGAAAECAVAASPEFEANLERKLVSVERAEVSASRRRFFARVAAAYAGIAAGALLYVYATGRSSIEGSDAATALRTAQIERSASGPSGR
jgi:hypothetical protein